MKISFIYHLYENSTYLEKSIQSLLNQTNKNFQIVFIDDAASEEVRTLLDKFDLSDKKFKIVRMFQNYGKSFSYNLGLERVSGEYVYFAEPNNIFRENFVETILKIVTNQKYDYISFRTDNYYLNDSLDHDVEIINDMEQTANWIVNCSITIRNKIFRKQFLEKSKILFVNYKNLYPIYFFDVLINYKKAFFVSKILLEIRRDLNKIKYTYNLYDILEAAFILSLKINESNLENSTKKHFQVWLPKLCIADFLVKMFESYSSEKVLSIAISKSWETLEKIDIAFRNNTSLNLLIDTKLKDYIKGFKPSFNYVKKNLIS